MQTFPTGKMGGELPYAFAQNAYRTGREVGVHAPASACAAAICELVMAAAMFRRFAAAARRVAASASAAFIAKLYHL